MEIFKIGYKWELVFLFFSNFILYWSRASNNVIVSGGQQRDSAIYI